MVQKTILIILLKEARSVILLVHCEETEQVTSEVRFFIENFDLGALEFVALSVLLCFSRKKLAGVYISNMVEFSVIQTLCKPYLFCVYW